ncbi:class I SAM-dependent methyltransferase [Mesonia aquimarina]|uniref:class I SAM-dependent methyltransferase n=1 Tax=Mesonia aquimarina TaxID=1504967 RepID=UPI000EF59143|nr:class I SAM-dependent methyltransferase [Mesonia aquimarina]
MLPLKLLKPEVQKFIKRNENEDISRLILKGSPFPDITIQTLAQQVEARKKAKSKLPSWYNCESVLYPKTLNLEQTSSEKTAAYKSTLVKGENLIDLTGGFGIDSLYFSKKVDQITHCELNTDLSTLAEHNFKHLSSKKNCEFYAGNGIEYLEQSDKEFDWIFIDPSRRSSVKGKVFRLEDCEPDVLNSLSLFLKKSKQILIKTSPLLDLQLGIEQLNYVKEIHIVALENEVKELLWVLTDQNNLNEIPLITINISKKKDQFFEGDFFEEKQLEGTYKKPLQFLYEPNSAILKSGLFLSISNKLPVFKLSKHSHLYTSEEKINFPGRSFKIVETIPFNKKNIKSLQLKKANITTRNFPLTVAQIRKKFSIKDGGHVYLFFTSLENQEKVVLFCRKN